MDQIKFKLPRNLSSSKVFSDLHRPVLHTTGVLAHGVGEFYYIIESDAPKDAGANADLLSRYLDHCAAILQDSGVPLPRHLAIQADNSSREQKKL